MVRVCFVCLGNICRSPTAEGIMLDLVREAGLEAVIEIDSDHSPFVDEPATIASIIQGVVNP